MRIFLFLVTGFLSAIFLSACGEKKTPDPAPLVQIGFKESGHLWFNYEGPDFHEFSQSNEDFKMAIGPFQKTPWLTAKGKINSSKDSNKVSFNLTFTSDRPFEVEFLGLAKKDDDSVSEEATFEKYQMPAGEKTLKFDRFILYVYE